MGEFVRTFSMDGVNLKVVSKEKSFDVFVTIVKGTYLPMKREHQAWSIRFKVNEDQRTVQQTIRIKCKNQKYPKSNLGKPFKKNYTTDDGIQVRLWIAPAFYLSKELREKYWSERDEKKAKKAAKQRPSYIGICSRVGGNGKNNERKVAYSNNNLFKPYQGGSCIPK